MTRDGSDLEFREDNVAVVMPPGASGREGSSGAPAEPRPNQRGEKEVIKPTRRRTEFNF